MADWHDVPCATCAFAVWTAGHAAEDGYATFFRGCLHPLMRLGVACRPIEACDEKREVGLHPVLASVQKGEIIVIEFPAEAEG